jgi:hypothetical protein
MNDLIINTDEFLGNLKAKGITTEDMGWNPTTRKLGYARALVNSNGSYKISFYYFDIDQTNIIKQCPRGFLALKDHRIIDFDNLLAAIA